MFRSIEHLRVMVAIIPNSYLTTNSAKLLRKYFIENKYISEIIDFKSDKVFNDKLRPIVVSLYLQNKTKLNYIIDK